MPKKGKNENIEIKYIYPDNYRNFKKYIDILGKNKVILKKEVMDDEIEKEILYKLLIYNLANTNELLSYNQLSKKQRLSHTHNDIKDIMLISPLKKIFGIKRKYNSEYVNNSREEIGNALKSPKMILVLGWKYILNEEKEFENLDDEIEDIIWLIFEKALAAISANEKEIYLTKHEKAIIGESIFGNEELYSILNLSYLDVRERANEKVVNNKDKKRIHDSIKELILIKSEDKEKIEVRNVEKGEQLLISEYLSFIFDGLARYKKSFSILTNINIRKSIIEYEKKFKFDLNEEKKDLAIFEQELDRREEYINNVWKEDFVKDYYTFAKKILKRIEIREDKNKEDQKLKYDRYRNRFLNYYFLEQIFALELFEFEVKYLYDKLYIIEEDGSKRQMEQKLLSKIFGLKRILGDIYEFPYVFMRKKIAKEVIDSYPISTNSPFKKNIWIKKTKKKIVKRKKEIKEFEKIIIGGLFYKKEYSIEEIWDMLNVDIMSWYEGKRIEILSQEKRGISRNLFEILENKDSLVAKWVISESLKSMWKNEKW